MTEIFVALGSNLGDRLQTLGTALDLLAREPGLSLRRWSDAWETEPVGPPQPRYLNAVAQLGSILSPPETLKRLLAIEEQLGRVRRERWGAREIDLDLLLFGDRVVSEPGLEVPHPRLHERAFVLAPLAQIAPGVVHPRLSLTAAQLLAALPESGRASVRKGRSIRRPLPETAGPEPKDERPA